MDSEEFDFASADAIAAVLSLDFKYDEKELFQKCLTWAQQQCVSLKLEVTPESQRSVMEPFIHMIAFSGMSLTELADQPCRSGILTGLEISLIYRSIAGEKVETGFRKFARKNHLCPFWEPNLRVPIFKCEVPGHVFQLRCCICIVKSPNSNATLTPWGNLSYDNCSG